MVAVQGAAVAVAAVFLALAVAGFIPGLTTHLDQMTWLGARNGSTGGRLFGMFEVSITHNLMHLGFGVAGLLMARTFRGSRRYLIGGGLFYLGLWLYGMLDESSAKTLPLNGSDNWLHFAIGVVMVVLGLTLAGTTVPTGADGEILIPEGLRDRPSDYGIDSAIPSRMSCSLTMISLIPARSPSAAASSSTTIAPPPITSTRPSCIGPSAARCARVIPISCSQTSSSSENPTRDR
jgi:hypothetical protein